MTDKRFSISEKNYNNMLAVLQELSWRQANGLIVSLINDVQEIVPPTAPTPVAAPIESETTDLPATDK